MRSTHYNKTQLQDFHSDCKNLSDLIAAVETQFQATGEVVCQLVLNGMALHEDDESRLKDILVEQIETLEIRSERPTALLFDVLKNWVEEIPRIIEQTDRLSQAIRVSGPEGQYTPFVQLVDSCQFLIESLISMDNVIQTEFFLNRDAWAANEKLMAEAIGQALDCFERKDYAMLADVLEYDLANGLQSWFDLLKGLSNRLQEENERDSGALSERIFKRSTPAESDSVDHAAEAADRRST